jgi:glycosyltransferase involved in cell wall biosynthesis
VLALGRIIPHKGFERTIRALPRGLSLDIVGQAYDAAYFAFLRQCAEGRDVRFHTDLDDAAVREHMARAGLFVHASTHVDYLGRFSHKPELLGLAPLEALSCGLVTLVSDAGSLAELGRLPGCFVFRSDAELAELLRLASARRLAGSDPEAMHAAVERGYGLRRVGIELLKLMDIAPA